MATDRIDKKIMLEKLLAINNMLDTYRTNINILIYNIYSNDKLNTFPDWDYDKSKLLLIDFSKILAGVKDNYYFSNAKATVDTLASKALNVSGDTKNTQSTTSPRHASGSNENKKGVKK